MRMAYGQLTNLFAIFFAFSIISVFWNLCSGFHYVIVVFTTWFPSSSECLINY
jgi:hypothetical protein